MIFIPKLTLGTECTVCLLQLHVCRLMRVHAAPAAAFCAVPDLAFDWWLYEVCRRWRKLCASSIMWRVMWRWQAGGT